jgi:PBP1b-binding outer membrane lipoprotein LpoB
MKKNTKQMGLLFLALVLLASCSSSKPAPTESVTKTITITETVHDTVFKIEKDSSSYRALLECQNGKVVVKAVTQAESGRSLKSPRVRVENNKLSVDCEIKKQELYAFWKSKQVKEVQVQTLRITKYINQLTFWQKLQIWLGRIFLMVLGYYAIRFALKFYRPF